MKHLIRILKTCCLLMVLPGFLAAQPFWSDLNGPTGASVRAVAVTNDGLLFVGTEAGVFRSTPVEPNVFIPYIPFWDKIMSIVPIDGTVLACTAGGLYASDDNGENWKSMNLNLTVRTVVPYGMNLLAATNDGIYTVVGDSWQPFCLDGVDVRTILVNTSGHLLVGTDHNIQRSTNGGQSWSQVYPTEYPVTSMVMNAQGHLFAGTIYYGVHRSFDGGSNWEQVNNGLNYFNVHTLAINNQGVLYAGNDDGLYRTYNEGGQWSKAGNFNIPVNTIMFKSDGLAYLGTQEHGMFYSSNDFMSYQTVLQDLSALDLLVPQYSSGVVLATEGGVYRHTGSGDDWTLLGLDYGKVHSLAENNDGMLFAATNEGVKRYAMGGSNWEPAGLSYKKVFGLAFNDQGVLFASTDDGLYRSDNFGDNWVSEDLQGQFTLPVVLNSNYLFAAADSMIYRSNGVGEPWTPLGLSYSKVHAFEASPDGVLFAAFDEDLYRSDNNGDTWQPLGLVYSKVGSLAFNSNGHVFAGNFGDGVLRSTNGGYTWEVLNEGLDYPYVHTLAFDGDGYLYAGTPGGGVYRSAVTTSVSDDAFSAGMLVYPNPAVDLVSAAFTLHNASAVRTELFNTDGRLLRRFDHGVLPAGPAEVRLSLDGLLPGVYNLRLVAGTDEVVVPVVVK